jgi:hypothetical protein
MEGPSCSKDEKLDGLVIYTEALWHRQNEYTSTGMMDTPLPDSSKFARTRERNSAPDPQMVGERAQTRTTF